MALVNKTALAHFCIMVSPVMVSQKTNKAAGGEPCRRIADAMPRTAA